MAASRVFYLPHVRGVNLLTCKNEKTPTCEADRGVSYLALDNDLLSHGETPHYHRRYVVSLLSSGWGQVVPTFYGRQAILFEVCVSYKALISLCTVSSNSAMRLFYGIDVVSLSKLTSFLYKFVCLNIFVYF